MRVGLDATPLLGRRTGVGTYVAGLLSGLGELASPPEVVLQAFTWRGADGLPDGYARGRRFPARVLQEAWSRSDVPPVEWLCGAVDVFHGTNFVAPPTRRAASVVTIHDLAYETHAGTVTAASLRYRSLVPRALKRGAHAVTSTRAVADRIAERYSADVAVAPLGVDPMWFGSPPARPDGLPDEYLVFVGTIEPRKNLPVLLDALRRRTDLPPLVLIGGEGWGPAIDADPRVVTPGYLPPERVREVVAHAKALVLPSKDEGFGLPPVEALACGTPVVVSDLPVLREVLGSHATYVPVDDADALAEALTAPPPTSREERIAHARTYTWRRCAEATMAAYERALR